MSKKILFYTLFILIFLIPSKQDPNAKTWERHNTTVYADSILAAVDRGDSIIIDSCKIFGPLIKEGTLQRRDTIRSVIYICISTFSDTVSFENCYFMKEVNFSNNSLRRYVDFAGTTFGKYTDFFNTTFDEDVSFAATTFKTTATFLGTTFRQNVTFGHYPVPSGAPSLLKFKYLPEDVSTFPFFREDYMNLSTTFGGEAYFNFTTFHGDADFGNATFDTAVSFLRAKFGRGASFSWATFGEDADFSFTTFDDTVSFSVARFSRDVSFSSATFGEDANFSSATFKDSASFVSTIFGRDADFERSIFYKDINLSFLEFENIKISWKQLKGHLICDPLTSSKLMKQFEEKRMIDDTDGIYLFMKDQERMEKKWYKRYPEYWFIQLTCGYAVKPFRTLIVCGLVIILFSVFYTKSNAIMEIEKKLGHRRRRKKYRIVRKGFWKRFYDALYFSVHTFIIGIVSDWYPTDEFLIRTKKIKLFKFRTLSMIEGALGWILLVLFVVTLTRKFIR